MHRYDFQEATVWRPEQHDAAGPPYAPWQRFTAGDTTHPVREQQHIGQAL